MPNSKYYEDKFNEAMSSPDLVRAMSEALAAAETKLAIKPKRVMVDGIVRDDILSATFDVKDMDVAEFLRHFLDRPGLDPDILVNGIIVDNGLELSVRVGRQLGVR